MQLSAQRYTNLLREFTICGFKLRDQGSLLGFVWTLLHPMLLLLVLSMLFSSRLKENIPHPTIYLLIGIIHWSFFSTATTKTVNSITGREGLVRNVAFPREILVISDVGTVLMSFVLEIGVLFVFVFANGLTPHMAWLALPIVILLQALLIVGVGLFLALTRVFVRDIERIWGIVLRIGFFCVPIFYTTAILSHEWQRILFQCNPLAQIMGFTRAILIDGRMPSLLGMTYTLVFGVLFAAAGLVLFKRYEPRFAEKL